MTLPFSLLTQQAILSEEESLCLLEENQTRQILQKRQVQWLGNLNRQASKKATQTRRAMMVPLVIKLKLQSNKLSQAKQHYLAQLFRETKYYYNHLLGQHQLVTDNYGQSQPTHTIADFDTKRTLITVKDMRQGELVPYELQYLSSQMRQAMFDRLKDSLKGLSQSKVNGHQVGKLQFKRTVHSLPLKQFDATYKLDSHFKTLKLQGCPFSFKLIKHNTLAQIAKASGLSKFNLPVLLQTQQLEVSTGTLIKEGESYYVSVLCYLTPMLRQALYSQPIIAQSLLLKDTVISLDAGITDSLTLTCQPLTHLSLSEHSIKLNPLRDCPALQRQLNQIACLNQKLSRTQKDSKGRDKLIVRLRKAYLRLTHLKNEIAYKLIRLLRLGSRVTFQDEMIKGWHSGWFGKQIQHNVLGRVYAYLRHQSSLQPKVYQQVARSVPTSQICVCGRKAKKSLKERVHQCAFCRIELDRDTLSSHLMNWQTQGWELTELNTLDLFERISLLKSTELSGTETLKMLLTVKKMVQLMNPLWKTEAQLLTVE